MIDKDAYHTEAENAEEDVTLLEYVLFSTAIITSLVISSAVIGTLLLYIR